MAAQREMRAGGTIGVLEGVRQSLLGDPEHGQLDTVGELTRVTLEIHRHRDPGGIDPCQQLIEPVEAWLGLQRMLR